MTWTALTIGALAFVGAGLAIIGGINIFAGSMSDSPAAGFSSRHCGCILTACGLAVTAVAIALAIGYA